MTTSSQRGSSAASNESNKQPPHQRVDKVPSSSSTNRWARKVHVTYILDLCVERVRTGLLSLGRRSLLRLAGLLPDQPIERRPADRLLDFLVALLPSWMSIQAREPTPHAIAAHCVSSLTFSKAKKNVESNSEVEV